MPRTLARNTEVLPAKRRALVLERVRRGGVVSVQELVAAALASPSTIRRDLERLTAEGALARTHGGAVSIPEPSSTFELEPRVNAEVRAAEKAAIGREAALRIRPGESVILDASSTVLAAARAAAKASAERDLRITAVTNSLDIGLLCATATPWRLYLVGGLVRAGAQMTLGERAAGFGDGLLDAMHADLCLIGAYAVTGGLMTDPLPEVAALKRQMIRAARRVVLLADGTKFRLPAFAEFARAEELAEVITDDGAPPEALDALRAGGTAVTVVTVDGA